MPFELVKIKSVVTISTQNLHSNLQILSRLQDKTSTFKGPMDVLKQVIRKEGALGLYAGMESTFWRYIGPNFQLGQLFYFMLLQTGILERRIFRLHSSSQNVTSKTRCLSCAFSLNSIQFFIFSAEPTSATYEQLRVWCHRWFCWYRAEYTVSHSAISLFISDTDNA